MRSLIEIYLAKIAPLLDNMETQITEDEALDFLEEAGQRVINYCRRADIPPSLRHAVASIARDLLIAHLYLEKSLSSADVGILDKIDINHVKKIAIGDTEVQLSTPKERGTEVASGTSRHAVWDKIINTYLFDLQHHRKVLFTGHYEVDIYE